MFNRNQLIELGFENEMLGKAFKAIKGINDRDECLAILNKLKNGESLAKTSEWNPNSCLAFLLNLTFCPSTQGGQASKSERRRMLENKAITFNGFKLGPDDELPRPLWEITFFKGAKRQCSLWWDDDTIEQVHQCMVI